MGTYNNKSRRNVELIKLVGRNIRKYRKLKGLTISQLSFKAKIDDAMISNYENGKVDTNLTMLSILAEALEIDIRDLLEKEE